MRKLGNRGRCATQPRAQIYNLQGSSLEIRIGGVSEARVTLELRAYRLKVRFSAYIGNGKSRLLHIDRLSDTAAAIATKRPSATNRRPFRSGGNGGGPVHALHQG